MKRITFCSLLLMGTQAADRLRARRVPIINSKDPSEPTSAHCAYTVDTCVDKGLCRAFERCHPLDAGQAIHVLIGEVCVDTYGHGPSDKLRFTYKTKPNWYIAETQAWAGAKGSFPKNKSGNPMIGNFPAKRAYTNQEKAPTALLYLSIETHDMQCCLGSEYPDTDHQMLTHDTVFNSDPPTGSVLSSETAWSFGEQVNDSKGSWAMGSAVTMSCSCPKSPSASPSITPSRSPSKAPSLTPSTAPSLARSDTPSDAPSDVPSSVPSAAPSYVPSDAPSDFLSRAPCTAPSDSASDSPSDVPSWVPPRAPSSVPSNGSQEPNGAPVSTTTPTASAVAKTATAETCETAFAYCHSKMSDKPTPVCFTEIAESYRWGWTQVVEHLNLDVSCGRERASAALTRVRTWTTPCLSRGRRDGLPKVASRALSRLPYQGHTLVLWTGARKALTRWHRASARTRSISATRGSSACSRIPSRTTAVSSCMRL